MSTDLMSVIRSLKAATDQVSRRLIARRWGMVTGVSPLRVLQDGDSAGAEVWPDSLVSGLVVGDRVLCDTVLRRTLVLGRAGGGLRIATGITSATGFDPTGVGAARQGDIVVVRGQLSKSSGNIYGGTDYPGALTIPVGFRPLSLVEVPAFAPATQTAGALAWVALDTDGSMRLSTTGSTGSPYNRAVFTMSFRAA